ncbi:hypothetical protein BDV19DRAFT_389649 [Aspergillus venezuelensis]
MACINHVSNSQVLFQGGQNWVGNWQTGPNVGPNGTNWTLQSLAHLNVTRFHGFLGKKTRGVEGEAYARTKDPNYRLDLTQFNAIKIDLTSTSDNKYYRLGIRDSQGVEWETRFGRQGEAGPGRIHRFAWFIDLKPFPNNATTQAQPFDPGDIRGFTISIQDDDVSQEGSFQLSISEIAAVQLTCNCQQRKQPSHVQSLEGNSFEKLVKFVRRLGATVRTPDNRAARPNLPPSNPQAPEGAPG